MEKKTNLGLVDYCKAQLGRPYWWGTFGQKATPALLENRRKTYPRYYADTDYQKQFGQKVHDCIGLIKGYMWTKGADSTEYVYESNGFKDITSDMCYNLAKLKGTNMATMPDIPGIAVFMNGHVGVYIGNGEVIEAQGHARGVVKTKLCKRPWTKWAFINEIEYITK